MNDSLTIADMSIRTGLSPRRLRYVLEHDVLPGGEKASEGKGIERSFTEFESFGIACAGLLLEGGLRRVTVKRCIEVICPPVGRKMDQNPLFVAMYATGETILEIGDNVNARIHAESILRKYKFDTGWLQLATGAELSKKYEPDVIIQINLGRLRSKIRG